MKKIFVKVLSGFLIMSSIVLLSAGRTTYWQGWLFIGLFFLHSMSIFAMCAKSLRFRQLYIERLKPGAGIKAWDRLFSSLVVVTSLAVVITGSLEIGRYRSETLDVTYIIIGFVSYILSDAVTLWAMFTNNFFSTIVRIQADRGQTVVREGPYAVVRHPGYAAAIITSISTALVLGSSLALIVAGIQILVMVIRTFLEDNTLQKELPGYESYARQVRSRLLPGVW